MKNACFVLWLYSVLAAPALGQNSAVGNKSFSVWNIHTRDVLTLRAAQAEAVAVLTPTSPIVVRRIEALSMRGPINAGVRASEPAPCPLPFSIEIASGVTGQTIPISTTFIKRGSEQTYTDSGSLNLSFPVGSRITVSLIVPASGFPPVACVINGMNISIQFESDAAEEKAN